MTPRQMLVATSKYALKCPYTMTPTTITIHNTANDASANNEVSYMRTNANATGFHIAVDDKEAVQGIPLNRNAWHAGDGDGNGNRKSIAIEICYSLSGGTRFTKAQQNAAKVVAKLLKDRKWGVDRLRYHRQWSSTACPHRTNPTTFTNMVKKELEPVKPKPTPKPTPKPKITYKAITKKSIELVRDANLWNFNFTDWSKAKAVQSRKKGAVIDNIVAIATNPLGATYYVTEYSYKSKITNGFNTKDANDYKAPVTPPKPVEPPKPTPEPTPEPLPEPPKEPDYPKENNALLKQLVELVKQILSKITNIFK